MIVALRPESAVVVVGITKGWTTAFDYGAWATSQSLHLQVGDSRVFSGPDQSHHTVNALEAADAYGRCILGGSSSVHCALLIRTNNSVTIAASLESKAFHAMCTVPGHCIEERKMKGAVLPASKADTPPTGPPTASDPNDADVNRYICWTIAILLFVVCFWNSS